MKFLSRIVVPTLSIIAIVLALYGLDLNKQQDIRINESIELSKLINNMTQNDLNAIDSLRNEIIQLKFQKESYTTHLQLMSDWFILFETVLFGIFFVVGYGIFDNKIAQEKKENETTYERINTAHIEFKEEFLKLKINHFHNASDLLILMARTFNNDPAEVFHRGLMAINFQMKSDALKKENNNKNLSFIKGNLVASGDTLKKLEANPTLLYSYLEKENLAFGLILKYLKKIISIEDNEVNGLCSDILSRYIALTKDKFPSPETNVKKPN